MTLSIEHRLSRKLQSSKLKSLGKATVESALLCICNLMTFPFPLTDISKFYISPQSLFCPFGGRTMQQIGEECSPKLSQMTETQTHEASSGPQGNRHGLNTVHSSLFSRMTFCPESASGYVSNARFRSCARFFMGSCYFQSPPFLDVHYENLEI